MGLFFYLFRRVFTATLTFDVETRLISYRSSTIHLIQLPNNPIIMSLIHIIYSYIAMILQVAE